jgi:hypothetical protein
MPNPSPCHAADFKRLIGAVEFEECPLEGNVLTNCQTKALPCEQFGQNRATSPDYSRFEENS